MISCEPSRNRTWVVRAAVQRWGIAVCGRENADATVNRTDVSQSIKDDATAAVTGKQVGSTPATAGDDSDDDATNGGGRGERAPGGGGKEGGEAAMLGKERGREGTG